MPLSQKRRCNLGRRLNMGKIYLFSSVAVQGSQLLNFGSIPTCGIRRKEIMAATEENLRSEPLQGARAGR